MQNDSKKFKKFKKAPLFISVIFLLLSSLAFIFVYRKIGENEKVRQAINGEWQAEAARRDEIRSLERSIKEIAPERAEIETHFAQSSNPVPFLDTLENLATLAGANSEVRSVDIAEDKSGLIVALDTKGSFASTYRFLRLLENSPYELRITSFDVEKGASGSAEEGTATEWTGFFTIKLLSFTP
jgi:hypothetical protein